MGVLSADMRHLGYTVNLEQLCVHQKFNPEDIATAELVYPNGAVPNAQLIWVRTELKNGDRKFITLPLQHFHEYIELPVSSIGGWTTGERGIETNYDPRSKIITSEP